MTAPFHDMFHYILLQSPSIKVITEMQALPIGMLRLYYSAQVQLTLSSCSPVTVIAYNNERSTHSCLEQMFQFLKMW